jgi:hypothetical protein
MKARNGVGVPSDIERADREERPMDARLEPLDYHTRFGKWDLFERGLLRFPCWVVSWVLLMFVVV